MFADAPKCMREPEKCMQIISFAENISGPLIICYYTGIGVKCSTAPGRQYKTPYIMVARQTRMFHPNARMIHPRRLG